MSEVAGRIEIEVESDTSGFAAALKRKLQAITKEVVAQVRVEADTDTLRETLEAKVAVVAKGVTAKVGVDVEKGAEEKFRAKLESVVKIASAGVTAKVKVAVDEKETSRLRDIFSGRRNSAVNVPARVDRKGLFASWLAARRDVEVDAKRKPIDLPFTPRSFRSAFMPVIYASIASLIQPLVAVIGGALGGLSTMAANLAASVKVIAAAPAALTGLLGTIGVIRGTVKLLSEDAEDLSGNAKEAAEAFEDMGEGLEKARKAAATRFLEKIGDQVKPVAKVLLPLYTLNLNKNADALANSAKKAADWIKSPAFTARSRTLIGDGAKLTGAFTTALVGMGKGLLQITTAASPMVDRISKFITRTGEWASGIGDTAEEAEELAAQFQYAGDKASQLWEMTKDIGRSIANIFKAGKGSGDSLLKSLETNLQKFREWTASVEGQNKIREWFEDIEPIAREVGSLIVEVGKALGRMAADPNVANMVRGIRQDLLPVLERFLTNMGRTVGPQVIELLENTLRVLSEMSEAGGPIATGLGYVNDAIGGLADVLAANPNLAKWLGTILGALLGYRALAFIGKMTGLTTLFSVLRNGLGGGTLAAQMTGFGLAVGGMTGAFSGLPGPMNGVASALGTFLLLQPMVGPMSSALNGLLTAVRNAGTGGAGLGGFARSIGTTAKTGLRGALSGLGAALGIGAAGGPAGAAIAVGLVAVSTAVGVWAQSHADAKAKAQAYKDLVDQITASLDKERGALTAATREIINQELVNNGAAQAARKYGVDLETLAQAATGNVGAQKSLNQQLGDSALKMAIARDNTGTLAKALGNANINQKDFALAVMEGGSALDPFIDKMLQAAEGDEYMIGVLNSLIPGLYTAADGHRVVADKAGASAGAVARAAEKYDLLAGMAGKSREQVTTVIAAVAKTKGKTFKMEALTSEAVTRLQALGYKVTRMPDGSFTITANANVARANAAVNNAARDRYATIYYRARSAGGSVYTGGGGQADGSILSFSKFAEGGIRDLASIARQKFKSFANGAENHVAQIARPGDWRVWAEPETGGEAYIPLAQSKRGRSLSILAEVAKRFGLALAPRGIEGLTRALSNVSRPLPPTASPMAVAKRHHGHTGPRIDQHFGPGSITVTNPSPEPASKSISDNLRHSSEFGILEGDND